MKYSRIHRRQLRNCGSDLTSQFRVLSFGREGGMTPVLNDPSLVENRDTTVHYILDENKKVVSWCISFRYNHRTELTTYFFTKPTHRRHGLGSRLARAAAKYVKGAFKKKTFYCEHDSRSDMFFASCRKKKILTRANSIAS